MKKGIYKKEYCKLCKRYLGTGKHNWDTNVHVKCGDWLDEIFHTACWNRLKIDPLQGKNS